MGDFLQNMVYHGNEIDGWQKTRFSGNVTGLVVDRDGLVWVVYQTKDNQSHLTYYKNQIWRQVSMPSGYPDPNYIYSFVFDQDNNLWMVTTQGILMRKNGEWVEEPEPEFNDHPCRGEGPWHKSYLINDTSGGIWGVNGYCIIHWNGANWTWYGNISYWNAEMALTKFDLNGKLWVGNGYVSNGKNHFFTPDKGFNYLAIGPDNSVWFATHDKLFVYDNLEDIP
jgi:hypothetical protein